jgi:penicillin-binding protein 1A
VKGWKPENYSHEYFGPVSLQKALALSLNTVSVRLTLEVGPQAVVRDAHRLGHRLEARAERLDRARHLGSLVMELVSAYVPFANGGVAVAPHVIERVRTAAAS